MSYTMEIETAYYLLKQTGLKTYRIFSILKEYREKMLHNISVKINYPLLD
jgi:hypothetical protein